MVCDIWIFVLFLHFKTNDRVQSIKTQTLPWGNSGIPPGCIITDGPLLRSSFLVAKLTTMGLLLVLFGRSNDINAEE